MARIEALNLLEDLLGGQGLLIIPLPLMAPTFGTMVIFLSNEFPHEVLPPRCSRYSLTGWFRLNATTAVNLDPPE